MKGLILILVIASNASFASAKLSETKKYAQKNIKTHSVLYNRDGSAICAIGYNQTNISSLNLPFCSEDQALILDAVKPDGVDLAFLSHVGAFSIGCVMGVISNRAVNHFVPKEKVVTNIAVTGAVTGISGVSSMLAVNGSVLADPTFHALAASAGVISCTLGNMWIQTFYE